MIGQKKPDKLLRRGGFGPLRLSLLGLLTSVIAVVGCTQPFYRIAADKEAVAVLREKDRYDRWKIEQFHVYPDPRARFADPTHPDKPPMPPDDPAARDLAPNPQKPPHKAGVAQVQGTGYLNLLAHWDAQNRAARESEPKPATEPQARKILDGTDEPIWRASFKTRQTDETPKQPVQLPSPDPLEEPLQDKDKLKDAQLDRDRPLDKDKLKDALPGDKPMEKPVEPQPGSSGYADKPSATEEDTDSGAPRPFLITPEQATELALFNSREFQDRREDLYLTALPVTLERFAFAAQWFATGEMIREVTGSKTADGEGNRWRFNNDQGFSKLFPTGALLLFRFANRTVVELTNPRVRHTTSASTINLDFIQPLLRGGGKAVTLEPLTQVERNLVYEIRDYFRFRELFYVGIVAGADAGFAVVPTAFGGPAVSIRIASPSSTTNAVGQITPGRANIPNVADGGIIAQREGFLPTLLRFAQLQQERDNVARLERYLERYRDLAESGEVSQLQIDQVEQSLLQGRTNVLQRELDYRDSLDRFKLQLGVPTNLPIELDNGPLKPLLKHLLGYEEVISQFESARKQADLFNDPEEAGQLRERLRKLFQEADLVKGTEFRKNFPQRWRTWERLSSDLMEDFGRIQPKLGGVGAGQSGPLTAVPWLLTEGTSPILTRLRQLRTERRTLLDRKIDLERQNQTFPEKDLRRIEDIELDMDIAQFEIDLRFYEQQPWKIREQELRRQRDRLLQDKKTAQDQGKTWPVEAQQLLETIERELALVPRLPIRLFSNVHGGFSKVLTEARNERLETFRRSWPDLPDLCLDGVDLLETSLEEAQDRVSRAALINRVDLMNARAQLVDAWRKIAVFANSLLGVFDVQYHLDSATPPDENRPFQFGGSRTRHQLILNYELPLVRKAERNNYRAALISYQRQRRALMSFEDNVLNDVRAEIRQLRVLAENYKIQQRQVELAYSQVENSLDVLEQPLPPGQSPTAGNAAALTQQLLNAQRSLPTAQTQLFNVWIQYLITRLQLYRDLELLPLDDRGVWIDDVATQLCPCVGPESDRQPAPQRPDGGKDDPAAEPLAEPRVLPDLP